MIKKGMISGLSAGLVVSLFDGLFMLMPNTYVPVSYPFFLIIFNVFFWTTAGSTAGLLLCLFVRNSKKAGANENRCWVVFFLFPFAVIYGLAGRMTIDKLISPAFDHHLSFLWVFLILLFLFFFRAKETGKAPAVFYIPEIFTFAALFMFCSNTAKIPGLSIIFNMLFSQGISDINTRMLLHTRYLTVVYITGVLLIMCGYFLFFFKFKPVIKKQFQVILALALFVLLFLSALFSGNRSSFYTINYPSVTSMQAPRPPSIPYVILIVLDTVRADRLAVYGNSGVAENLEKFSRDALVFENCIASSPWTLPSHASLFTGLYPVEHGAHHVLNKTMWSSRALDDKFTTLADIFKSNGYLTSAVVSNCALLHKGFNLNKGFQIYDCTKNIGATLKFPFRPLLPFFSYLTNVMPKNFLFYRPAEEINSNAAFLLKKMKPDPFFLFLNYMDAHAPYVPPRPFNSLFTDTAFPQLKRIRQQICNFIKLPQKETWDSFMLSQYDGEIAYLDHYLGELFSQLKKMKLYDPSLIIITADHGELFGEHGLNGHYCAMYEEVLKVPLMIKFPFNRKTGREKNRIGLHDLFSTILSICDLPIPDGVSGRASYDIPGPVAAAEFYDSKMGRHRVIYDGKYKYMKYSRKKKPELYDLLKDPSEQVNLTEKLPETRAEMEKTLAEWNRKHVARFNPDSQGKTFFSREIEEGLKALGYIR